MNYRLLIALSLVGIFLMSNLSLASAKNVALAVANANSLDPIFEQPLYNILTSMNNTVTAVDQNSNVNLNNFDLLVVAGRPPTASPLPSSFAASLPVNSMPTIAIDYYNLYNWGWVQGGGVNTMTSGSIQSIYIAQTTHPITSGYSSNQRVFIHNRTGLETVDLVSGTTNFAFVAYMDQQGDGAIAFAAPNTMLTNGHSISSHSASVYFGTTYPGYWTNDTVNMFENAVNWILNLNYNGPSAPVLSGPSWTLAHSATYSWSAATGANGIQNYEIQASTTASFSQIMIDTNVPSFSYTLSNMQDSQRYYVRVRSIDYLNLKSQWSNVISTIADFSPIIITINSPAVGSQLLQGGQYSFDVSVSSQRVNSGALCNFNIDSDSIGSLIFNQTTQSCFGSLTIPQLSPGSSNGNLVVSIQDEFGATNSTSIPVTTDRAAATTVTSTQTTSVITNSGSSDGNSVGSGYYTIFDIVTPDSISDFVNTDHIFTISARNDGNIDLHATKLTIVPEGDAFTASMNPQGTFDIASGQSKTFTVTLHTPSTVGNYYLDVRSLSYETTENVKRIPIHVTVPPVVVDFGITNIEIPDFTNGVSSLANITVVNKGNVVGTANVNLDLPDGWTASSQNATQDILPNQQTTLAFEITPSLSAGNLTFSGTFYGSNTTKSFSYPVQVSAKENPNPLASLTGTIASTLGNPVIAIPTVIAASVAVALYYKLRTKPDFSKYIWPRKIKASLGKVVPKTNQINNFSSRKANPSSQMRNSSSTYDKWEKKFGRS